MSNYPTENLYSLEAERSVLGSVMLDNHCTDLVINQLTPTDFHNLQHQQIFRTMCTLYNQGQPIDLTTFPSTEGVKDSTAELAVIMDSTPTAKNIQAYVTIVKQRSQARKIIAHLEWVNREIKSAPSEAVSILEHALCELSQHTVQQKNFNIADAILPLEKLLTADIRERKNLLPWLPRGGLAMVFAQPGIGKTHFALSLAAALSSNFKFMRWQPLSKSKVLFIDGEMSLADIRQRLIKLKVEASDNQFMILSHENFYKIFEKDLTITEKVFQEEILRFLDANNIDLLILDNLSSLSRLKENESDPWREVMNPFLIACRRRGIAVLIVHHSSKGGTPRGTVAREDILDTIIKLERIEEEDSPLMAKFKVIFTKSRGCCGEHIKPFHAGLVENGDHLTWKITSIEESTKEKFLQLIGESGEEGITAKDLAENLQVSEAMISKLKKELIEKGIITSENRKAPLKLTAAGREKYAS